MCSLYSYFLRLGSDSSSPRYRPEGFASPVVRYARAGCWLRTLACRCRRCGGLSAWSVQLRQLGRRRTCCTPRGDHVQRFAVDTSSRAGTGSFEGRLRAVSRNSEFFFHAMYSTIGSLTCRIVLQYPHSFKQKSHSISPFGED
jgi:hypothetical protein